MTSIKAAIKERMKKLYRFYYMYREIMKRREERRRLWREAVDKYSEEQPKEGNLSDYKHALIHHRVSYDEYMHCFEYWNLEEKQRDEYISEMEMRCVYRKTVQTSFDRICSNKVLLLRRFNGFVHRKWAYIGSLSFEEFENFVSSTDCIVKPIFGTMGRGVFLVRKDDSRNCQQLFEYCSKNEMLVEERLRACREMEEFHPHSLNTIRVFTISKDGRCEILASEFRVGVGDSVVDNASTGGIVAAIDLQTGTIIGNGVDKAGNNYEVHPNSGKMFKGFAIPYWNNVVDACKAMSAIVPEMVFAGWDISVLQNGEIEMIEVNSYPQMTGLQMAYHKGLKPRLSVLGKEVLGYDPVGLISVWSKSYVKYEGVYGRY